MDRKTTDEIDALLVRGGDSGCVSLSNLREVADDEAMVLYERLDERRRVRAPPFPPALARPATGDGALTPAQLA